MDDEDETEFDLTEALMLERESYRVRKIDVAIAFMRFPVRVAQGLAEMAEECLNLTMAHANWDQDQHAFEDEARREIESLTGGE